MALAGAGTAIGSNVNGFMPIHHFADMQPEPDATLLGQGFIPPDFNTGRLRMLLARLAKQTENMERAANWGEQALVTAGASAEQAARHADRAYRLPMGEPGTEAMGEFEGFFPPRWWATWGRTAMGSCEHLLPAVCALALVHAETQRSRRPSRMVRIDVRGGFL
ncbi:unnamed protein product [Cladocopium goreaui]|uniref:Uncharacterized protein n=1 Tax=Cladocopium goreaui TaxID=2562237 RepID=A0A9P1G968_9DINO|nr:unnamed protein product [Cladocopium goreaui]